MRDDLDLRANYANIKKLSRKEAKKWLESNNVSSILQAMLLDKIFGKEPLRKPDVEEETPSVILELFKRR